MVFSKYRKEVYPLFPRRTRRGGQKFQNNHIEPYRHVEFQQYYNMDDEFSNDITIESTYKAPHHDEPEDLTDDLAPNMARQSAQQPTNLQLSTGAGASENKLNFKFQKTVPKNPDWTEYQNKFRSIGGGSPDNESADAQTEVKQEPNKDQPANTGFIFEEDVEMKEVSININIDTSDLKVAVTTEPYHYLTVDQVKGINEALENRIQNAILNSNSHSYIPVFEDIPVHHLGHLPLSCQGPKDLYWLHDTLTSVPTPVPNVKLTIIPQTSLPDRIRIEIFVPNYSGSLADLQYNLEKQNSWYDMKSWMLVKSDKQGIDPVSYTLQYSIPQMQALIIDNRDRRINYSLGNLYVKHTSDVFSAEQTIYNHRNVAEHLKVCVVTEPFRYLTLLEVELIKLALIYKLEKDAFESEKEEYIPAFRGCPTHFKGGLKLWCESDRDLKWLKDAVGSLASPVTATRLVVKPQSVIPHRTRISISVPSTDNEHMAVKILTKQNIWLDVETWVLFSTRLDPKSQGLFLTFYVPPKHVSLIQQKNCRLSFLLGYVDVLIHSE